MNKNNSKSLLKMFLFIILTATLFLPVLSMAISSQDIVQKENYVLGDSVLMQLTDEGSCEVVIKNLDNPEKVYKYKSARNQVVFDPLELGDYEVQVINEKGIIKIDEFKVIYPSNPILLSKENYSLGEEIGITILNYLEQDKLYIEHNDNKFRFLGKGEIKFVPTELGSYKVLLERNNEEFSKGFEVIEELIPTQEPAVENEENRTTSLSTGTDYVGNSTNIIQTNNSNIKYGESDKLEVENNSININHTYVDDNILKIKTSNKQLLKAKMLITQGGGGDLYEYLPDNYMLTTAKNITELINTNLTNNNELNNNETNSSINSAIDVDPNEKFYNKELDLELELDPSYLEGRRIKKITFEKTKLNKNSELRLEKLDKNDLKDLEKISKLNYNSFAIDPSSMNFTNGTIEMEAQGLFLWKCAQWNFTSQTCFGSWKRIKELVPGQIYNISFNATDPAYSETGVAAINTKKSEYFVNEEVDLTIAALDYRGFLVSGANITLIITSPNGINYTLTNTNGNSDFTEVSKGLYESNFSQTNIEGEYWLHLSIVGNGINNSMLSHFFVNNSKLFDIIRVAPTTIDPWREQFTSTINLISYAYQGRFNFTEVLPLEFEITDTGGAQILIKDDKKLLTWTNLNNNSEVTYSAQPPLKSPDLWEIGKSIIYYAGKFFIEKTLWFLAIDPAAITCSTSPCTATSAMIQCTAASGEPNAPNTIDSCADATQGNCHSDESVESITVTDLNNSIFYTGDTIEINVTYYCWNSGTNDYTQMAYHNGTAWVNLFNEQCGSSAYVTKSFTHVLDDVEGNHTIRGIIVYSQSGADPGAQTCGAISNYDDNDDVTITVIKQDPPTTPTNLQCDSGDNCNITVDEQVVLEGLGSTDPNSDTITYMIERTTQTNDSSLDQESSTQEAIATNGASEPVIQRGVVTFASGDTFQDIALQAVDLSKTFVLIDSTSVRENSDIFTFTGDLTSTTNLRIERASSGTAARVSYQVIETDNVQVYKSSTTFNSADNQKDITIPDLGPGYSNRSLVVVHVRSDSPSRNYVDEHYVTGELTSSTNLRLDRDASGAAGLTIIFYVLNFTDSTFVQTNQLDLTGTSVTDAVTSVQTNRSWLYFTSRMDTNGLARTSVRGSLSSSTLVDFRRISSTGGAFVRYYLVEFPDSMNAFTQANSVTSGTGVSDQDVAISLIDPNKTITFSTEDSTGTGSAYPRSYWIEQFTSNTNLRLSRDYTGQTSIHDWQVVRWPDSVGVAPIEANVSLATYQDVTNTAMPELVEIKVAAYVDTYVNSGSTSRSNNNPDINVELYDGSSWIDVGSLGVNGGGNFSLTTTNSNLLSNWLTTTNRDVRLTATNMDYDSGSADRIVISGLWVTLTGTSWTYIGNHTAGNSFTWNTGVLPEENCINLRTRAIDLLGSNTYSSYFTKDSCLNISHAARPEIGIFECERDGTQWTDCSNIPFRSKITRVRANCTHTGTGTITGMKFTLENLYHSVTLFADQYNTTSSGEWLIYDNSDIDYNMSGDWEITGTCYDNASVSRTEFDTWNQGFGTLSAQLVDPSSNTEVQQDKTFNFTAQISCVGGECGNITAVLDPVSVTINDFESSDEWTHAAVSSGVDNFHRSTESAHSGIYAWKFGSTGTGNYASNSNAELITSTYTPLNDSLFSFYHYMNTESTYDVGKLEYRVDSGSWTKVTTAMFVTGAYNNQVNNWGSVSGFTNNEDVWTGNIGSAGTFQKVVVNLSSLSGSNIQFRFRFMSDTITESEGWYIDYANFSGFTDIKGVVPMYSGNPYYTTTANPMYPANNSCLINLIGGGSCNTIWLVNATGAAGTVSEFFVTYNSSYTGNVSQDITSSVFLTITINGPPPQFSGISATPSALSPGDDTTLRVTVTDADNNLNNVYVNITSPGGSSWQYLANQNGTSSNYYYVFNETLEQGIYTYYFSADDNNGNNVTSDSYYFKALGNDAIIGVATQSDAYQNSQNVLLTNYVIWNSGDLESSTQSAIDDSYIIFSDGFESGLGNWVIDDDGGTATIDDDISDIDSDSLPRTGTGALYIYGDNVNPNKEGIVTTTLDLTGRSNIILTYYWTHEDLESDDSGYLSIYDGAWNNQVQQLIGDNNGRSSTNPSDYILVTENLSASYNTNRADFQIRIGSILEGTYYIDLFLADDILVTANPIPNYNLTPVNYSLSSSPSYKKVTDLKITVTVNDYLAQASDSLGNDYPDLRIGVFDGSSYVTNYGNSTCNLGSVYGTEGTTDYNCTIIIRDQNVIDSWSNVSNRLFQVQPINLDGNDTISWDYVDAELSTASRLENYGSKLEGRLLMQIYQNNSEAWNLTATVVNQSYNVSAESILNIAGIWNAAPWNTGANPTDTYKVYAAFLNSTGGVISTDDGYLLNDSYVFELTTRPIVNLQTPADGAWVDNSTYQLIFYAGAPNNLANCTLYLDGVEDQTKTSGLINYALNLFTVTGLSEKTYTWSVNCTDTIDQTGYSEEWTFDVDYTPPTVNLIDPVNNSIVNLTSLIDFKYNVSDTNLVTSCALYINDSLYQTDNSPVKDTEQIFTQQLTQNGNYYWEVRCTDEAGNTNTVPIYYFNLNYTQLLWLGTWYEYYTGGSAYTSAQTIDLQQNYESSQNYVELAGSSNTVINLVNAFTPYTGGNGVLIKSTSAVNFRGYFRAAARTVGYVTWKLFVDDGNSTTTVCFAGNDRDLGTLITPSGSVVSLTDSCTPSSDIYVGPTDKLKLVINIFSNGNSDTYRHYWDSAATASYVDIDPFVNLGLFKTSLTLPVSDGSYAQTDIFTAACSYDCDAATCINSDVILQYKLTSSSNWINMTTTGGLTTSSTNPVSLGSITNTSSSRNYFVTANQAGVYDLRCYAYSDYSESASPQTREITVISTGAPNIVLNNPANNTWTNSDVYTLYYTPTDATGIDNCSLYFDGVFNQTNITITNGAQNSFYIQNLLTGNHTWQVNCTNDGGTSNVSLTKNLIVDFGNPSVTLLYPPQPHSQSSNTIEFNWTVTDAMSPEMSCDLFIDGFMNVSGITVSNNTVASETVSGLSHRFPHTWDVDCYDLAGNAGASETRDFNVTDTPPGVLLTNPPDNNWTNQNPVYFYYIPSDNNIVENCSLIINEVVNTTVYAANLTLSTINNFSVPFAVSQTINWTVQCFDDGEFNTTATPVRNLNIDVGIPSLVLNAPGSGDTLIYSNVSLNFTTTDDLDSELNCSINLNVGKYSDLLATSGFVYSHNVGTLTDGAYNWNVTCADEVGNSNLSETRTFTVAAPPKITMYEPSYGSWQKSTIIFDYYVFDNENSIDNCTLIFDGSSDQANTSITNGNSSFTKTGVLSGSHSWTVNCTDTNGYSSQPTTVSFNVDANPPAVSLTGPANGTYNVTSLNLSFISTDDIATQMNCTYLINNVENQTVLATNNTEYLLELNFTDGTYYWNVTCADYANNTRTSDTRWFQVITPTTVTIVSPEDDYWTTGTTIDITYNADHRDSVANCSLYLNNAWNQTNTSISEISNVFEIVGLQDGEYNWYINCTSTTGSNGQSEERFFTVDNLGPVLNLIIPSQGSTITTNTVDFNFTSIDEWSTNTTCNLSIDDVVRFSNIFAWDYLSYNRQYNLHDGNHNWTLNCWDPLNNTNTSTNDFTVDAPPTVTLQNPGNNTLTNNQLINFTFTPYDIFGFNYCALYVDASMTYNLTNANENVLNNITISTLPDGDHDWYLTCEDVDNNAYTTGIRTFGLDTQAPSISLQSPPDLYTTNQTNIIFNFTATDNYDDWFYCNITANDVVVQRDINVTNNTLKSQPSSFVDEDSYDWNVTCWDAAGNVNTSESRTFSTVVPPIIILNAPENNSYYNTTKVTFDFNLSDATGIENCSIIIDGKVNVTKLGTELVNNGNNIWSLIFDNSGVFDWSIRCYDNTTLNAMSESETRSITLDLGAVTAKIKTQNNTWYNTATPQININVTDDFSNLINYTLFVNGSINTQGQTNNSAFTNITTNVTLAALSDGYYEIILQAADQVNNKVNSTPIFIYVDTKGPNIVLSTPPNDASLPTNNVTFNFTPNDLMANNVTCNLSIDNSVIQTFTNANVGVLISYSQPGISLGTHYWNVTCVDYVGNYNTSLTRNFTVPIPDFVINTGNITFSNSTPGESDTVTVNATVFNIGTSAAVNVTVRFYRGDPDNAGVQIGTDKLIALFNQGENYTFSETFTALVGSNAIYVVVDPPTGTGGLVPENSESNNKAYNIAQVGLYNVFTGLANSALQVADSVTVPVWSWFDENSSQGRLYVADSDASISFNSLQALGRQTDNSSSGNNDFETLDTQMSTTNLTDNINATWTNSGLPKQTTSLDIFGSIINNIPIINSTTVQAFKTGILWDTSDGGVQYTGAQDIVFMTVINESQVGSRGTYDYELKVPTTLDQLVGVAGTVTFYSEII